MFALRTPERALTRVSVAESSARVLLLAAMIGTAGVPLAQAADAPAGAASTGTAAAGPPATAAQPDLRAAIHQVEKRGYRVESPDTYSVSAQLKALIGRRPGAVKGADNRDATASRVFFFDNDRFIGTDSVKPSAGVHIAWQNDHTVAVQYALYRHADPICCPTGGNSVVRFSLERGKLVALDPLPSDEMRSPGSSR
jgi:hypothetical protein